MATYKGIMTRTAGGGMLVQKDGRLFRPTRSQKLYNHSPDGFNWGYGGSGPAQLALALLLDVTDDEELALRLHQPFKWDLVARWGSQWTMTSDEIQSWINRQAD